MAPVVAPLKPVQEMLKNGVVPERYVQPKDNQRQPDADGVVPLMDTPVVDFSLLSSNPDELEKLHSALSSWGCAQVNYHYFGN